MGDFEEVVRIDGEDNLTPKLDDIATGFKRVTDAIDYLAEISADGASSVDNLATTLGTVGESAIPALTTLHNTFLILGMDIEQVDAQTNALIAKNGELASSYTDLVGSEKEQQLAMLTGLETQTLLQSQMGAALPVLEQTGQLYREMEAQSSAYMRSLGQLADVSTLSADATRTLSDGTIVAKESLQTAGGAALLAASQTRVYDEALRGVDVTLQQTALEQQAVADACNAATQAILSSTGATKAEDTALRFSINELNSLTEAFSASTVSIRDMVAAGYDIKNVQAGLQVLMEGGTAAAAAMKVLSEELGRVGVAIPALLELHNTFNILGQDITKVSADTNELIAKNAQLASSYVDLTVAEKEQQVAMLTGIQTQLEARQGVVEIRDALAMTKEEQLAFGEATLKSMTNMYAQGIAAGEDADKLAVLRAQIVDTARQMDKLADSGSSVGTGVGAAGTAVEQAGLKAKISSLMFGNLGKEMEGVAGVSQFLLFTLGMMALGAGQQMLDMGLTSDDALKRIQLQTGVTDAQMQTWDNTIRDLGSHWGFTLTEAAQGLDLVTRSAFRGTDATTILNQAMILAVDTGSSLADSTNLLIMSMKSYGVGANQAANYTDILNNTFKNSRLTIPELTSLMGNAMPVAVGLGISLKDLGSTVDVFSQATASGIIATRDFQSMLSGLSGFTSLDAAALAKLANTFDLTKFKTMDFTQKLADLAKTAGTNEGMFTSLIGGMGKAKQAMDNLDISTKQLAVNAANLGVSFDPVKYNALDAAGKLLYLLNIVSDSPSKFAKLTDGTKATNAALADLGSAMDKSAQHLANMGSHFDMAKFKSADLAQKLYAMADFLGGQGSAAFIKFIGGEQNLTEAHKIMATEVDKHIEAHVNTKQVSDAATHITNAHTKWILARDDLSKGMKVGPVDTKPYADASRQAEQLAKDNKHAMDTIKSDWSSVVDNLVRVIAPHIIDALHGLGKELHAGLPGGKKSVMEYLFGDWQHEDDKFRKMLGQMTSDFNTWRLGMDEGFRQWAVGVFNAIKQFSQNMDENFRVLMKNIGDSFHSGLDGIKTTIQSWIDWVIRKFLELSRTLVGASIIPDMIKAITRAFTDGGTSWRNAIQTALDHIKTTFDTWSASVLSTINTWRSNMDQSFRQGETNWENSVNQARLNIDQSFRQGATDWLNSVNQARLGIDQRFREGATDWTNSVNQARLNIDQSFRQGATDWLNSVNQARLNIDQSFRQGVTDWTNTIVGGLSNLASSAWQGALNVSNSIANGIRAGIGAIASAAGAAAQAIRNFLPSSPAKEGPLMHLDEFMPGMIDTLISTMQSHQPKLQAAAMQLATSISLPVQGISTIHTVGNTGGTHADMSAVVSILVQIYQVLRSQQGQNVSTGGGQVPLRSGLSQQQLLQALYHALNGFGGLTFESGARGAFAGLGV